MKTVTQRLRKAFHAIDPLCGFTGLPSVADARLSWGFRTSHVDESCHASNVPGQRRAGSGLPKSSHSLPLASFHKTGWPSGTGGAFGVLSDFVQIVRSFSNELT